MRELSLKAMQALYAQETGEVLVSLITITHPQLASPLRLCNDYKPGNTPTISRNMSFLYFPFDATFPLDRSDQPPQAKITADVVDRSVITALRAIPVTTPAMLKLELVLASQPDIVEVSFNFTVRNVQYDALTVTATLGYELFLSEPYPGDACTPANMPGIFL